MAKEQKAKAEAKAQAGELRNIPLGDIIPTPDNTRRPPKANDPEIIELAQSIRERGVLQPVLARPHPSLAGKYDMRFGARRLLAAKVAGLTHIPAIVREMDDREALEATVAENLQREDITPLEEGQAVALLLEKGWDAAGIAAHLGKSVTWVHRRGRLKSLSAEWVRAIEEDEDYGNWHVGVIEAIASLPLESQQEALKSINPSYASGQVLAMIANLCREIRRAPWKKDDVTLVPERGACADCRNRSCFTPGLFDDEDPYVNDRLKKGDRCLNAACWDQKLQAHIERRRAELQEKNGEVIIACENGYDKPMPEAVSVYSLEKAAKGEPGAKCVLLVDGPKAGTTFYARKESATRGVAGATKGVAGEKQATPLSERKQKLDWRRKAWVADQVKKMLHFVSLPEECEGAPDVSMRLTRPPEKELIALAIAFGANAEGSEDWDYAAALIKGPTGNLVKDFWEAVAESLETLLASKSFQKDPTTRYNYAIKICSYTSVDTAALDKAAEERFPVPKSWAKLNEDGSTKLTAGSSAQERAEASARENRAKVKEKAEK